MLTGLPKDPILLLSVVNTKLRDYYPSLDALCDDMDVSREVLEEKLGMIDYRYDAEKNQFEQWMKGKAGKYPCLLKFYKLRRFDWINAGN